MSVTSAEALHDRRLEPTEVESSMPTQPEPIAVSPATAAEMLDCSRAFIYILIDRGELRRSKIGRASRIPIEDVRALLAEGIAR